MGCEYNIQEPKCFAKICILDKGDVKNEGSRDYK